MALIVPWCNHPVCTSKAIPAQDPLRRMRSGPSTKSQTRTNCTGMTLLQAPKASGIHP